MPYVSGISDSDSTAGIYAHVLSALSLHNSRNNLIPFGLPSCNILKVCLLMENECNTA